tara:strand:+ start:174 stop:341 length:168 start_codon:yes stop_codon:yes gene_type:complete
MPVQDQTAIKEFFTEKEWDTIYDAVTQEGYCADTDEVAEDTNSVLRKISRLFEGD